MENREQPPVRCVQTRTVYADGREEQKSEMVLCEHALDLVIDGKPFASIICTRRELREISRRSGCITGCPGHSRFS